MLLSILSALVAGAFVWWAGTTLSRDADALAAATGIGRAFLGVVLLGVATSLPEIATTVTAGVLGNAGLATGNLMGGVALQIVVLAGADAFASRRPLTVSIVEPVLLLQHVVLLLLLALAIAGMALGEPFSVLGVGIWPLVIAAVYLASLAVVYRGDEAMRWTAAGAPSRETSNEEQEGAQRPPTWRIALSGAVILVAGWVLARSGDRLAESPALDATFVGAGLVALATSLPEVSTVIGSIRAGAYDMAVSNIVGTNSLEVALLLLADVALRDGPLLSFATSSDIFLAALGAVLTCLYLGGLLLRHDRDGARLGRDSLAVIAVYAAGMLVLSFG